MADKLWHLVSENALLSAIVAGFVVVFFLWLLKVLRDKRESEIIYAFLQESSRESGYRFRSTHVISAATKIPESRVAELCSRHPKIKRNEQERQTWRLED